MHAAQPHPCAPHQSRSVMQIARSSKHVKAQAQAQAQANPTGMNGHMRARAQTNTHARA